MDVIQYYFAILGEQDTWKQLLYLCSRCFESNLPKGFLSLGDAGVIGSMVTLGVLAGYSI
ncbi:hypothetical protein N7474_003816 [Penicillium riverlandense]|uniref:uncharacterized protein n=1 Tax=Penicillium riverlandense TaxID=1903569 RepID=UPI0025491ACC|nr:uncharacterized protein N7474_003816 [Penicillium riverlandense]KAJ5818225.1 hypothetical protein N7474_003816 [Penicillium riverlandense]